MKSIADGRRRYFVAFVIFCVSFTIYQSNSGFLISHDSAPTSLAFFNAVEHHTLSFDDFNGGYLDRLGADYAFTRAADGHTESIFPIGTAILTSPIYAVQYAVARASGPFPEITLASFEGSRLRYEKRTANVVAALCAALFFLLLARFREMWIGAVGWIAFSFGTNMWTVGSQALWQHGSVALVLVAMTYALLASGSTGRVGRSPMFVAGLLAGFLPVVRPTAMLFSIAGLVFAYRQSRSFPRSFAAGFVIGIAPGIAWNWLAFHRLDGGYVVNEGSYDFIPAHVAVALSGLLLSPSRGLLIFCPFALMAVIGMRTLLKRSDDEARLFKLLTIAAVATIVNYACFQRWEGGAAFGPRYLTDLMPIVVVLCLYALPTAFGPGDRKRVALVAVGGIALLGSIAVQVAGANGDPKTNWSEVPDDVSFDPARLWSWHDSQIQRDVSACYRLWTPRLTARSAYVAGFEGRVTSVADSTGTPLTSIRGVTGRHMSLNAVAQNVGASPWLGYESGAYYGEARVRARFADERGAIVAESYLFIPDIVEPHGIVRARGFVTLPTAPGNYRVEIDVDAFQSVRIEQKHLPLYIVPATIGSP